MPDLPSINDLIKKPVVGAQDGSGTQNSGSVLSKKKPVPLGEETIQQKFEKKIGEIGVKERETEAQRFAGMVGIPHIDLDKFPISQSALRQIPLEKAKQAKAICFFFEGEQFRIGALDPRLPEVKDIFTELQQTHNATGAVYVISKHSFDKVIKLYDRLPTIEKITKDVSISTEDLEKVSGDITDFSSIQKLLIGKNITDLVTYVMGSAVKMDASDVHVEAEEARVIVRFRIDGILHEVAQLPKDSFGQFVGRIKLLAGLKINIIDKPQDGRFGIKMSDGDVDLRVSTMPNVYGESIVLRLLRQTSKGVPLSDLGMSENDYKKLVSQIERPNGMVITTGPTGSGKTTTLYSVMYMLNKPEVKIITLEDPVEYKMPGINQSQIDKSKDYTFAKGLKSILRQDPDICMVGEIRDLETAEIAVQAALTGHLILSTLHTNSAAGAIARFLSMGLKAFLLAPALNAVMGQRLVRKLCDFCKEQTTLSPEEQERVNDIVSYMSEESKKEYETNGQTFFKPKEGGCEKCGGLGFKGRIGIYEIIVVDKEMEKMILEGAVAAQDVEKIAISKGMTTMVQDGLLKSAKGITSLSEVFRVIQ